MRQYKFGHTNIKHHSAEAIPLSHTADPRTSYGAADRMVKSGKLNRQEEKVYKAIKTYLEDWPIDNFPRVKDFTAKNLKPYAEYYTIQRRLSGLHRKGKIERIQANDRGRLLFNKKCEPIWVTRNKCCVWRLTNAPA